jgi:hypothetical protein
MLTDGEFVMSKGAVDNKFGIDTLASMNAMGGGTNIPLSERWWRIVRIQGGGSCRKERRTMTRT